MLNTIIVEDEDNAREMLQNLLAKYCPEVNVLAACGNIEDGLAAIEEHRPDLLFLDIEMQTGTGFDLLEKVEYRGFEVIFTTAYDTYALKAIKFSAIDYLLKPIDVGDLQHAVQQVEQKKHQTDQQRKLEVLLSNLNPQQRPEDKSITLSTSDGLQFVKISDIVRCEANGAYTNFVLKNRKDILVSKNLKEYENLLSDYSFYRIHHSHLINLSEVDRYVKADGGYVVMKDGSQVGISNKKKDEFLALMSIGHK